MVLALPLVPVVTRAELNAPAVVVKETSAPDSGLPLTSSTNALMTLLPPVAGTVDGLAPTTMDDARCHGADGNLQRAGRRQSWCHRRPP